VTLSNTFGSQIKIKTTHETGGVLQDYLCCFACEKQTDNPDRDFKGEPPLCAGPSNRGASVLLAHDFQFESVVCYTFEGRAPQFASKQTAFVWQRCCACAATLIDAKAATDL